MTLDISKNEINKERKIQDFYEKNKNKLSDYAENSLKYTQPTWLLTVKRTFDAAHHIPEYKGKCKDQHGHTYHVTYYFWYTKLNELAMGEDFAILKHWINDFENYWLDHKDLNEKLPKEYLPPTAEHIAKFIYDKTQNDGNFPISKIELQETPNYGVIYFEIGKKF